MRRDQMEFLQKEGAVAWCLNESVYVDLSALPFGSGTWLSVKCGFNGIGIMTEQDVADGMLRRLIESGYRRYPKPVCPMPSVIDKEDESSAVCAKIELANEYLQNSNYDVNEMAYDFYCELADRSSVACNGMGLCYEYGRGVERDYRLAIKWYEVAARCGSARAESNLALAYQFGKGVNQDLNKAVYWFEQAEKHGLGTEVTPQKLRLYMDLAFKLFNDQKWVEALAAASKCDQNDPYISAWIGYCYKNGYGVEPDYEKAFELFSKSAEQGNDWSMNELGCCYENGIGVEKNSERATYWYRQADMKATHPISGGTKSAY